MFENYGANIFSRDTALRMNAFCGFRMQTGKGLWNLSNGMDLETDAPDSLKKTADGKALAFYKVANPLSVPLTVKCRVEIRAYFRELVGGEETTLRLAPHERVTREVPFAIIPDSRRYSMDVQVSAVDPPALGWPAADTISFFPGVRQSVPWPDPFKNEFRRCISFRQPLPGVRQSVSLDGPWEIAFTTLPTQPPVPAPAGLKWEPRCGSVQCRRARAKGRTACTCGGSSRCPKGNRSHLAAADQGRDGRRHGVRERAEGGQRPRQSHAAALRHHRGAPARRERDPAGGPRRPGQHGSGLRQSAQSRRLVSVS